MDPKFLRNLKFSKKHNANNPKRIGEKPAKRAAPIAKPAAVKPAAVKPAPAKPQQASTKPAQKK